MRALSLMCGKSKGSIVARTAKAIVAVASPRRYRDKVGCIILYRGENDAKVREWLSTAASVPGFVGFAVGRTDFWDPLVAWRDGKETRDVAVEQIATRYREFTELFESARASTA